MLLANWPALPAVGLSHRNVITTPRSQPGVRIVTKIESIAAALLFCLLTSPTVRAEITIDVSRLSCKEFMSDVVTWPDNMAYWLSGYYNGKRGNTVIDVVGLRDYANKVEQYCISNKEMTVMKAAETVLNGSK
jgi:acid stress chaperone HdeB